MMNMACGVLVFRIAKIWQFKDQNSQSIWTKNLANKKQMSKQALVNSIERTAERVAYAFVYNPSAFTFVTFYTESLFCFLLMFSLY